MARGSFVGSVSWVDGAGFIVARLDRHGFTLQARLDTGTALFRHSSIQARLHRHGSIQARLYRHGPTGTALQARLYRHGSTGTA